MRIFPASGRIGALLVAASVASGGRSFAQTDAVAAAELLFREGRRLLEQKDFARACPKLAESVRLDPATGSLLALAICHEGQGRTATAWKEYAQVASRARREGRADREQAARDKVSALEPALSMLTVSISAEAARVADLRLKRDGEELGSALWGVAVPVHPGPHTVEASAPGRKTWQATVAIGASADKKSIEVPGLVELPVPPVAAAPVLAPAIAPIPPPYHAPPAAHPLPLAMPLATIQSARASDQPQVAQPRRGVSAVAVVGVVAIVAGVLSAGTGGYFAYRAYYHQKDYLAEKDYEATQSPSEPCYQGLTTCAPLADANRNADRATAFVGAGLGATALGIFLYALSPSRDSKLSLTVAPTASASAGQLTIGGHF